MQSTEKFNRWSARHRPKVNINSIKWAVRLQWLYRARLTCTASSSLFASSLRALFSHRCFNKKKIFHVTLHGTSLLLSKHPRIHVRYLLLKLMSKCLCRVARSLSSRGSLVWTFDRSWTIKDQPHDWNSISSTLNSQCSFRVHKTKKKLNQNVQIGELCELLWNVVDVTVNSWNRMITCTFIIVHRIVCFGRRQRWIHRPADHRPCRPRDPPRRASRHLISVEPCRSSRRTRCQSVRVSVGCQNRSFIETITIAYPSYMLQWFITHRSCTPFIQLLSLRRKFCFLTRSHDNILLSIPIAFQLCTPHRFCIPHQSSTIQLPSSRPSVFMESTTPAQSWSTTKWFSQCETEKVQIN